MRRLFDFLTNLFHWIGFLWPLFEIIVALSLIVVFYLNLGKVQDPAVRICLLTVFVFPVVIHSWKSR